MSLKHYTNTSVLTAARERIAWTFDEFEKVYISFSGGKDSTVMMHLVMDEAIKRGRTVGCLIVDLEAQYQATSDHVQRMVDMYREHLDLHWCCLPMGLSNGVSNFEPRWIAWEEGREDIWVREMPADATTINTPGYDWYQPGMEFEEFVVVWADWYAQGDPVGCFVGIRADESLNRFRTIALWDKDMRDGKRWTTRVIGDVYNVYPLYDWRTADIWRYHNVSPDKPSNPIYDLMHKAGVPLSQQRLCQPFGHDQRKGLWLYHILEPHTWFKLIARVNGANSGAFYIQERGNINGYGAVTKPEGHTWESFTRLLLGTMPDQTREHYEERFRSFIKGWNGRGYDVIPDEAPKVLEDKHWAPSWRRMAKVLLRNDWWCKGLGMQQPKSDAYGRYLDIKRARKAHAADEIEAARFASLSADPVTSTVALFDFGFDEVAEAVVATVEAERPGDVDGGDPISDRTRRKMFALLAKVDPNADDDTQRKGMSLVLGREVTSRADLTEDDAHAVIAALQAELDRRDAAQTGGE